MPLDGKHVVKIGNSFKNKTKSNLVTFQYDFIPDSVEKDQPGQVTVESDNSISVNLANKSGSYTQFKGTFKESLKDCVLLVNKNTGEMTLERLDYIVNLKNTRTPGSRIKRKSSIGGDLSDSSNNESVKQKLNKKSNEMSNDRNSKLDVSDDLFGEWDSDEENDYKNRQPSPKKQSYNNIDLFDFPQSAADNSKQQQKDTNQHDLLFGSYNKTNENKAIEIDQSLYDDLELTDSDSDMNDIGGEIDQEKINVVKDDLALSDSSDSASSSSSDSGSDSD